MRIAIDLYQDEMALFLFVLYNIRINRVIHAVKQISYVPNTDNDQMSFSFGDELTNYHKKKINIQLMTKGHRIEITIMMTKYQKNATNSQIMRCETERVFWFKLYHLINIAKRNQSKRIQILLFNRHEFLQKNGMTFIHSVYTHLFRYYKLNKLAKQIYLNV